MNSRLLTLPIAAVTLSISAAYGATATTGGDTGAAASPVTAGARSQPTDSPTMTPTGSPTMTSTASPTMTSTASPTGSPTPSGPACGGLPTSGPGSPAQIAGEPVVTAISQIPDLSTLTDAVKRAGLVDTLNSAKDITVFAPTNDAFDEMDDNELNRILADKNLLTRVLTYHVVQGRKSPADLKDGSFTTLEGGKITTRRSDDTIEVNNAEIVCGELRTHNATVYLIDEVLRRVH